MTVGGILVRDAPIRFWHWWVGELSALAAMLLPRNLGVGPPELVVSKNDQGAWVAPDALGGRHSDVLAQVPTPLSAWVDARSQRPVRLRLAPVDYFLRRVEVPKSARRDIARFLALDLERATPFKPAETRTAYAIDDAPARPGFMNVQHVVAGRQTLDTYLSELTSLGFRVTHIDCETDAGPPLPINLLSAATGSRATGSTNRGLTFTLLAVTGLLAATPIAAVIARYDAARDTLVVQTTQARTSFKARRDAMQSAEALTAQARAVRAYAQSQHSRVRVLNELARVLPDTAWLTDLRIDRDTIEVSGYAKPAAALIAAFEATSIFADAELTSAITREDGLDRERFSIRARLNPARAAQSAVSTPEDVMP